MCIALTIQSLSALETAAKKTQFVVTENFDKAQELAQAHAMPIVLVFTGLDFCTYSLKLYEKILLTQEFAEEVNKKFVFVKIDFKDVSLFERDQLLEQHIRLKKRYAIDDFPQLVLLDPKGLEIAKLGYSEEIPMEYGRRLVSLWSKYRALEKEVTDVKRLTFERAKALFIEAKEMGAVGILASIIDAGIKIDRGSFFYLEAYRQASKEQRKQLRDKNLEAKSSLEITAQLDLIDLSESSGKEKEQILARLRDTADLMQTKGIELSKVSVHLEGLLETQALR